MKNAFSLLLILLLPQLGWSETPAADSIYFGGDILTMAGAAPEYVEAVAISDGVITYAGSRAGADKLRDSATRMVDLQGRTLLPGFIDPHSHIMLYVVQMDWANLYAPPMGTITSIEGIVAALKSNQQRLNLPVDAWLFGMGYDADLLEEQRHPSAADLDRAFPDTPVVIMHVSGHMVVANSAAMAAKGVTAKTPDPPGGVIVRKPGSSEPQGLFQEMALQTVFLDELVPKLPVQTQAEKLEKALQYYASFGLTTAQEGGLVPAQLEVARYAASRDMLPIDLVVLPVAQYADALLQDEDTGWGAYDGRLKLGGLKITLDGSPQGKTAFLSAPYLTPVPGCDKDCLGTPQMSLEEVDAAMRDAYTDGIQLYAHCNGDGAIDMLIAAHTGVVKAMDEPLRAADRRTVVVHSQIMRPDQVEAYARLGLIPTFFTNHTYFWGDVHLENLGLERASFTSPMRAALDKGIRATNHTDFTVTAIDPLFTVWSAVNRVSRNGEIIGPEQRIGAYEALKAITIDAAYQYFEEDSKGSLEVGKRADLVVLDRNPLQVDVTDIRDIRVLVTLKDGEEVYRDPLVKEQH